MMTDQEKIEALRRIAASGPAPVRYPDNGRTYWNGQHTFARRVRVIVGKSPAPTWWCADLEGTTREAVEVIYGGVFYLDNEDGSGWRKVTIYRGYPQAGHSSIPVAAVLP